MKLLFVGGSASEKSKLAEDAVMALGGVPVYVATMQVYGEEGQVRVARHRAFRAGKGFFTVERPRDFGDLNIEAELGPNAPYGPRVVLLECLGNLIANEMFREDGTCLSVEECARLVLEDVAVLEDQCEHLVAVANDIGSSGEEYTPETQAYVECSGCVSCRLAARFDTVVESVCGIANVVKGSLPWES